jgi:hypothetical protein
MEQSEVASWCAIALSLATAAFGIINHKRVRSNCCGKEAVASLDIEDTTPPGTKDKITDGHVWQLNGPTGPKN